MLVRKQHRPINTIATDTACEQWVKQEIETYLSALHSYEERAAQNPCLSFEQHLFSVVASNQLLAEAPVHNHDFED